MKSVTRISDETARNISSIEYFDVFSRLYANFASKGFFGKSDRIYDLVNVFCRKGADILDVGIGSGESAKPFAAAGHRVTGIDGAPSMIEHCRKIGIAPAERLHITDIANDAFPLPDESFDAVICNQTLYFLEDPSKALAEMARVAKPGAVIAFNYQAAPANDTLAKGNNATGYDSTHDRAEVKTYRHPEALVREFAGQAGLQWIARPQRYIGYEKMDGEKVDFDLCLLHKPSL